MSKPIFPIIKRPAPVLEFLRGGKLLGEILGQFVGVTPETLTPAQKALAEKFKVGIASVLGVPPEAIREEVVEKWVIQWSKAFVKPEYWKQAGITW